MKLSWLYASCLLALLAGCGPPAGPSLAAVPAAQLPDGYKLQNAEKYGISIGIPPGWKVASGETQDPKDVLSGMGTDTTSMPQTGNAQLDKMGKDMDEEFKKQEADALAAMEAKGVIIHVMSSAKGVMFETPTHFAVVIYPNPAATLEEAARAMLDHAPGEEKPVPVKIPAGPAMLIKTDKKMRDGGEVFSSKYVLQDGKTLIVVLFITEADPSSIRSIEQPVIDSLRVVPGKAVPPPGSKL